MSKSSSLLPDLANVARGACMGAADVVPGVSGGTVALIVGIYNRLVMAISHIDIKLVTLLKAKRFRDAANHMDLRFLMTLAVGLAIGFLVMTATMHHLLTKDVKTYSLTLAVFSGMIMMSAVFVARNVSRWNAATILTAAIGIVVAGSMAFAKTTEGVDPSMAYIFVSGSIAICAMILPGISGAMILMLLGVYLHLSAIPHQLKDGQDIPNCLLTIAVFGSGCLISLILFSKFLKWLLNGYYDATMATMCGFMVGALPKLWPFQRDLTPEVTKFRHKQFELYIPETIAEAVPAVVAAVVAAALVFAVDRWSTKGQEQPLLHADS
jgi:putative membrane protein